MARKISRAFCDKVFSLQLGLFVSFVAAVSLHYLNHSSEVLKLDAQSGMVDNMVGTT